MPEHRTPWRTTLGVAVALIAIFVGGPLLGSLLADRFVGLVATFHLSMWSLWVSRRIQGMISIRREVVAFRAMSKEQQEAFLATLWPSGLRNLYLRMLDPDERYEVDGTIARFPFPRAERRLLKYLALGL